MGAPTPAPPTTAAPTTSEPEPEPEPEPETSLPAPTPTPTQAATPASTTAASTSPTTSTCSGEPCDSVAMCRSQWGHCGSGADYCNAQSLWRAGGCTGASASTSTTPSASTSTTSSASAAESTSAAASTSAATSSAPVSSECIDVQGSSCSHCMATNHVCYAETKSWCDDFQYTWCGSTSLMQQSSPNRKRARSQAFLGFIQIARSLSSREW